jgi:anti-sigma factor RsiW
MTCKEIEDQLPGMIDGALPETEKKRIEAHLETCASCRKTFADLRISDERVKSLEDVEPPPWLKTRVMARVREEAEQKEGFLRRFFYPLHIKIPIQALATVLIAVVAWNVYKTGEPEFRQMAPPSTAVQEAPLAQAPPEPGPAAGTAKRRPSRRPPHPGKNRCRSELQLFVKKQRPMPKNRLSG